MKEYPKFMRNPANAIDAVSQSRGVEGWVYDGADGSQMAFWQCKQDGVSSEHVHDYDEYFVVVDGVYTLILGNRKIPVKAGEEYLIPNGVSHAGEFIKGTRTIHAFGGKRARRVGER